MSEKSFENRIKRFLSENHCWFVKYWGGGSFTKAGIPDILCCCNGTFIGIEVKARNGKPSDLQLYNLNKIDESGGLAVLLYPNQFDEFQKMIKLLNVNNSEYIKYYQKLKLRWCKHE